MTCLLKELGVLSMTNEMNEQGVLTNEMNEQGDQCSEQNCVTIER